MGQRMARRTKRLWTDEEKRSICFQTTAEGVSVAQVDVTVNEDQARNRTGNGAENLALLCRMTLKLARRTYKRFNAQQDQKKGRLER